jgi:hypothetical protein
MHNAPVANPEHLALIKGGVHVWNRWREDNPDERPDLRRADRSEATLSDADLRMADLREANLREADLRKVNLRGADLRAANLGGANLREADLRRANFNGANLSWADLRGADLSGANLSDRANLGWANLSAANLSAADLHRADLGAANLSGANLSRANLSGANLGAADLTDASVGWTLFADVDLSVGKRLDTIKHRAPSTIGIDTICKSGGRIPEVFLRGAGVPEAFVTYIGSLVGKPIEFYSCFISYSTRDQEFADRLYADMQAKGVRCWFAPEELKIGDRFRDRIDESIRLHDKLLIVLSERSIASAWVRREVEAAFEREDRQKSMVLFPVQIDDSVMNTNEAWAADIRRTRHIGDFSRWKDHDFYRKAFERLLRDLKAEARMP